MMVLRRGRRFDFARQCRDEEVEERKVPILLANNEFGTAIDRAA
jgi:hypothetical protein